MKCHLFTPQGVAIILYEFARADVFPGKAIWKAAKRIRDYVPSLSDRALVALSVTLAKFDWPEKRLLKKISAQVREPVRLVRMDPQMLVTVLHSYSKLNVRNVQMLEVLDDFLARNIVKLEPRYVANLAYSMGRLGVRGKVWE